jgi:hypothetical protein
MENDLWFRVLVIGGGMLPVILVAAFLFVK